MNILYLHGLLGRLNDEKREVLENHGKVFAPDIDYQNDLNTIAHLVKTFAEQEEEINVVIGSSMGGFAGWYVSNSLKRPALLFNPAPLKEKLKSATGRSGSTIVSYTVQAAFPPPLISSSTGWPLSGL